ncbi:MAG: cysteine desulfurase-like protein [Kofleriaceae bacterium]|nr:cysteine desulfurase-like protein [Kofleriaceae bacterium]MCB9570730.1 cysteine desulfurase-like protein [Kofleriaceae bacterium]
MADLDLALDLARVRAEFPALGSDFAFFDNAGGSQTLRGVADRVRDYLLTSNVQLGASYEVSRAAGARVAAAVAGAAAYVHAASPDEIVLGPSTTQLLANLALAMRTWLRPGDEVVVSRAEHEANAGPWCRLAAATGAVVRWWPLDPVTLRLEPHGLAPLLGPRTRLVAFTHASNLLGTIHDVAGLTALAHGAGARVVVDGVAYAPHRAIDVRAWDVDAYVFSAYKVYGPHLAVLYGKRDLLAPLPGINHDFIGRDQLAYKLQPGNLNFELAHGLGGVFAYVDDLGGPAAAFARIAAHEEALAAPLLAWLRDAPGVRVLGEATADRARRVPTISFTVAGRRPEDVVRVVDGHRVGIRHGDFYARRLVEDLGLADAGGVIRASMVHYNTHDEVARLIEALAAALR